ncbi:SbcC/MukB-like Walker B domain-containing protein [Nonomuraea sp. NPDC004702]
MLRERQDELRDTGVRAEEFTADVGLPTEPVTLEEVKAALTRYRLVVLAQLWPAIQAWHDAHESAADAQGELDRTKEQLDGVAELAAKAGEEADAAYRTLTQTAGTAIEELFRQLDQVERELRERVVTERATRLREQQALQERGKAEGERDNLRKQIAEAATVRGAAVRELQAFAATGLLKLALTDLDVPDTGVEWAATPAVLLARAVNAELDALDDGDSLWERAQKKVAEEHKLPSDVWPGMGTPSGDLARWTHDRRCDLSGPYPGHARAGLGAGRGDRATRPAPVGQEHEILENHLLNEVAGTLHERRCGVRGPEDERRAGSPPRLHRHAPAPDLEDCQERPRRAGPDQGRTSPDRGRLVIRGRAIVGGFPQERIAREHADNPAAGWTEALTRALDYRAWHEFAIQRLQDGQWRAAAGRASGGERVLAASVPLFAAALAYYKSAGNPYAPRLVALDEAFAGVDDDSPGQVPGPAGHVRHGRGHDQRARMGCYPQVPGWPSVSSLAVTASTPCW